MEPWEDDPKDRAPMTETIDTIAALRKGRDDLSAELHRVNGICNGLRAEVTAAEMVMSELRDEIEALTTENGVLRRRNIDLAKQAVKLTQTKEEI